MAWTERYISVAGGGAHDGTSEANAWTLAEAIAAYAAGQRLNVKAGTYANTTTDRTFAAAGTTTSAVWVRGYNTTIGDIDTDNTLAKPVITFTTGRLILSGNYLTVSNLDISGAQVTNGQIRTLGTNIHLHRCRVECTAANSASRALIIAANTITLSRCWFKSTASADVVDDGGTSALVVAGCVFEGGAHGLVMTSASAQVTHCIFDDQGGDAMRYNTGSGRLYVTHCTIYSPASDGIEFPAAPAWAWVAHNYFEACGGYGLNNSSGVNTSNVRRFANDFYNNTSGTENGFGDAPSLSEQSESSSALTNAAGDDFSLTSGSSAKASGMPGTFENESYTSYLDIGAVQRQEAGGGGGLKLVGTGGLVG